MDETACRGTASRRRRAHARPGSRAAPCSSSVNVCGSRRWWTRFGATGGAWKLRSGRLPAGGLRHPMDGIDDDLRLGLMNVVAGLGDDELAVWQESREVDLQLQQLP